MRRSIQRMCLGLALLVAAWAQSDQEYVSWMKAAAGACGAAKKAVDAKALPDAVEPAEKVADAFGKIEGYWKARNSPAAGIAHTANMAASELAAAAKAGDAAKASAALQQLTGTCKTCHEAHREKNPNGGFTIKP